MSSKWSNKQNAFIYLLYIFFSAEVSLAARGEQNLITRININPSHSRVQIQTIAFYFLSFRLFCCFYLFADSQNVKLQDIVLFRPSFIWLLSELKIYIFVIRTKTKKHTDVRAKQNSVVFVLSTFFSCSHSSELFPADFVSTHKHDLWCDCCLARLRPASQIPVKSPTAMRTRLPAILKTSDLIVLHFLSY